MRAIMDIEKAIENLKNLGFAMSASGDKEYADSVFAVLRELYNLRTALVINRNSKEIAELN